MRAATNDDRYERGLDAYASQFRIAREDVAAWFAEHVGERFGEESIYSAARAWDDDELSLRDRSLIVIAALIVQGDTEPQLRSHTRWALDHGSTRGAGGARDAAGDLRRLSARVEGADDHPRGARQAGAGAVSGGAGPHPLRFGDPRAPCRLYHLYR